MKWVDKANRRRLLGGGMVLGASLSAGSTASAAMPKNDQYGMSSWISSADLGVPRNSMRDVSVQLQRAITVLERAGGGVLELQPGVYRCHGIEINGSVSIIGMGQVLLIQNGNLPVFIVHGEGSVRLENLVVRGESANTSGDYDRALIELRDGGEHARRVLDGVRISDSPAHGVGIFDSPAVLLDCEISTCAFYGVLIDSQEMVTVERSTIMDIGNNGIRVERAKKEWCQVRIAGNKISRIRADWGGEGPNGNGVSVWRAHGVMVEGNRIEQCRFSAMRTAEGDACHMINNQCTDLGETAIYMEFGASGAIVQGNRIERTGYQGIALTNWNFGGRHGICSGNFLKDIGTVAITVEAQSIVQANIIEGADRGIIVGTGPYQDDVLIVGNMILDTNDRKRLENGILVSSDIGAGAAQVSNNHIKGARSEPVYGHDRWTPVKLKENISVSNNSAAD